MVEFHGADVFPHIYRKLQGPQSLCGSSTTAIFQLDWLLADVIHYLGPQLAWKTDQRPGKCFTIRILRLRGINSKQFVLDVMINFVSRLGCGIARQLPLTGGKIFEQTVAL